MNPNCIYLHLGFQDILKEKSISNVLHLYDETATKLLKTTQSQICFSLSIPSSNNMNLIDEINYINRQVIGLVSTIRAKNIESRNRIFTYSNQSVSNHTKHVSGIGNKINERGQNLLWIKLKDGLRKALRLPRDSASDLQHVKHNINKRAHD